MTGTPSLEALVITREQAAGTLEDAIAAVGAAYRAFGQATTALGARLGLDLAPKLEGPIVLHCAQAGLGPLLERKLTGTPASLRALVREQHIREHPPSAHWRALNEERSDAHD